jgi:hypothetical protein
LSNKGATETSVLIADPLALPIAKGIAGPGLLAETVVKRWCDHQPLHRQESIFARDGLELARSTLSEWHMALALLAAPLIQAMKMDAFQAPYLCTDATGVLVQAPERCKNGHFWVLVAPDKHVLFEFSQKHDSDATAKLLDGYKGYLVADAHVVYDHLYRGGQIVMITTRDLLTSRLGLQYQRPTKLSLLCRLVALVPVPRFHMVPYFGVLARAAKWRPLGVPKAVPSSTPQDATCSSPAKRQRVQSQSAHATGRGPSCFSRRSSGWRLGGLLALPGPGRALRSASLAEGAPGRRQGQSLRRPVSCGDQLGSS